MAAAATAAAATLCQAVVLTAPSLVHPMPPPVPQALPVGHPSPFCSLKNRKVKDAQQGEPEGQEEALDALEKEL